MIGITGCAVYVPRWRIRRETIAAAWGARAAAGCKAVMHYDEDPLTMGQATAWRLLRAGAAPEALYFASTTAPYWQRSAASLIASACDLPAEFATADFGGSLRCGLSALRAALDGERNAIVVAADAREGAPESAEEMAFGDAAAAVSVGPDGVAAEVLAFALRSDDFLDEWRRDTDLYVRSFPSKYSLAQGYEASVVAVGRALLGKAGIGPADVARAALVSPDGRAQLSAAKALGIPRERVEDTRAADLGVTGAAMPLLLLAQALERARPGEVVLGIGYGDGAEGILLRVVKPLPGAAPDQTLEYPSYPIYRKLREYLKTASAGPEVSNVLLRREEPQTIRLHGVFCPRCGTLAYPIGRVCASCRNTEGLVERPLGRTGTVFTFTRDYLYDSPVQPTVMAVVDLDGGGRFLCQMTDVRDSGVAIGMRVELVLRRMREAPGAHHYYWKCRPI